MGLLSYWLLLFGSGPYWWAGRKRAVLRHLPRRGSEVVDPFIALARRRAGFGEGPLRAYWPQEPPLPPGIPGGRSPGRKRRVEVAGRVGLKVNGAGFFFFFFF